MQGYADSQAKFQSTILRPPHADELALIGTIRTQNPTITFDNGVDNFGFYRDDIDDNEPIPTTSSNPSPSIIPPPGDWIELRPTAPNSLITTEYLPPAQYEVHSYPNNNYFYSHPSPSILPRVNIIDYQTLPPDYDNDDDNDGVSSNNNNDNYNDESDNFHIISFRRPDVQSPQIQRTDTATEAFSGNYSTLLPKSILKSGTSMTPPLAPPQPPLTLDMPSQIYSPNGFEYPPTSPRMSVKINTDESIAMDYPMSAIERIIPQNSIFPRTYSTSSSSPSPPSLSPSPPVRTAPLGYRMRFASVSQLNDVEWEVPSEFQTVVYDLTDDNQQYRGAFLYNSSQNFNVNNNNNNDQKSFQRKRSQSAGIEQKPHVSRVFIPWESDFNMTPAFHLAKNNEQTDVTQQQAFEY